MKPSARRTIDTAGRAIQARAVATATLTEPLAALVAVPAVTGGDHHTHTCHSHGRRTSSRRSLAEGCEGEEIVHSQRVRRRSSCCGVQDPFADFFGDAFGSSMFADPFGHRARASRPAGTLMGCRFQSSPRQIDPVFVVVGRRSRQPSWRRHEQHVWWRSVWVHVC